MSDYLDLFELCDVLGASERTLRTRLRHHPSEVPPPLHSAAFGLLRWRKDAVQHWLYEQRALGIHQRIDCR
jgi:hypothetical protein